MQIILLCLKIISIPLIIIVGESQLEEKNRNIALLVLAFLYNNLLGVATWFMIFFLSVLPNIIGFIIIGSVFLTYLITINVYVKRKIDMNMAIYVLLSVTAFVTGMFLF